MEAALHQELGLPLADELDRLRGGGVAVRRIHDPCAPEIDPVRLRDLFDLRARPHEDRRDEPVRRGVDRAGERARLARMRDGRRHGLEAPAARQQLFVLSGSCFSVHDLTVTGAGTAGRAAGPVSLRRRVRRMASPTPYSSGWNAVW